MFSVFLDMYSEWLHKQIYENPQSLLTHSIYSIGDGERMNDRETGAKYVFISPDTELTLPQNWKINEAGFIHYPFSNLCFFLI